MINIKNMKIIKKEDIGIDKIDGIKKVFTPWIPKLYEDCWLENCDEKITTWVEKKDKKKHGLYIFGSCGTGKTYSLYSLFRNVKINGYDAKIINTVELLRLFKKDFKEEYQNNFEDFLTFKGVLFIDDIGAEKNSEFVDETLYHLINTRHERVLPTFFSSNLSLSELAEKNGDRLTSRIAGMCEIIELNGDDKRLK